MSMPFGYFQGINRTIAYALEAHSGTNRKEDNDWHSLPYIFHPVEVAKRVWSWGLGDDLMLQAAVLHDVIEDCPGYDLTHYNHSSGYGIQDIFGKAVADLVVELTLLKEPNWTPEQAKRAKLQYMESFADKSLAALTIKLADRFCNVWDFLLTNPKYAYKYFRKADPVYQAAHDRQAEMMDAYGEDVLRAIRRDYRRLCEDLDAEGFITLFD